MGATMTTDPTYMMGRTAAETNRLIQQSHFLNPATQRLLIEAGIAPGMRVLDVGSGAGDVALVAANLVGRHGEVVGVDLNPAVLTTARTRAAAAGLTNVRFVAGDIREIALEGSFDAVIGRLVLIYVADPVAVLRQLASRLRPGGIVAFQEYNFTEDSVRSYPALPSLGTFWGWMRAVVAGAGIDPCLGYRLRQIFLAAGLPEPWMRLESEVGGGPDWAGYAYAVASFRSMLPLVLKLGIATEEEVSIDTLADRMRDDVVSHAAVVKLPDLVGAWTRLA
jgi:ubiquinone/menaquinone biosynthesis C-methylase UbiE